nr:disease resistance protein RPS6-like [Quercus suber]
MSIQDVDEGVFVIKNRLRHKRILLVLDDINQLDQLKKLVGKRNWFGSGSRVIITTRDKHLLRILEVDEIFEVEGLSDGEALNLLSLKAFKKGHPPKDYLELSEDVGTEAIQGIVLKLPKSKEAYWNPESFSKMHNLKLLIIRNVQLLHEPKHLPIGLRFLEWKGYPSKSLPSNFQSNELVELYMCGSYIEQLWKGAKSFEKLQIIQMNGSTNLKETPDLLRVPNLKEMVLEDCLNLRKIHPSTLVHNRLTLLNLQGCVNVKTLPSKFEMESLEVLILSGCSKLKKIPEFGENMQRVLELYLGGIAVTKLSASIGHLTSLVLLNIRDCKSLTSLPSSIFNLKLLKNVNISGCSKLEKLPEIVGNESVEELDMSGTAIREVPSSIGLLKSLKVLSFSGCKGLSSFNSTSWYDLLPFSSRPKIADPVGLSSLLGLYSLTKLNLRNCNLREIPNDIGCLFSLEVIDLSENSFVCLPDSISQLRKLETMYLNNCTSLRALPNLPVDIVQIWGNGCTSLEMVPDLQKPNSFCKGELYLLNCSKLANNQDFIDIFLAMIRKHHQGFSRRCSIYDDEEFSYRYDMVIPGSVIPKWFIHQSIGAETFD